MANNWFQFKQFLIHQDGCAMKVTTDACLFGAWLANRLPQLNTTSYALDIGTGTGLLSLMLAQQHKHLCIDAVEIDSEAAAQAETNVASSAFASNITVHQKDVFHFEPTGKYDVVFSNPPFHQNQLKANVSNKNLAHHDEGLTLDNLIPKAISMINENGMLALLLPYYRLNEMLETAIMHQLTPVEICSVKQSSHHQFFRCMFLFCKKEGVQTTHRTINICDDAPNYSAAFKNLLLPYYLNL